MKVILNLPCELEEVPAKLFLLAQSDWNHLKRTVEDEVYKIDSQYVSATDVYQLVESIRESLVALDGKLESTMSLLREQQVAVLGIGASDEQEEAGQKPTSEDLQEMLGYDYDSGTGLPTGSE